MNEDEEYKRQKYIRQVKLDWQVWRKQKLEELPSILDRINAIKGKPYPGYGFHYALVQSFYHVGNFIASHMSLVRADDWIDVPTTAEVLLESLIEQLEEAEGYIRENRL